MISSHSLNRKKGKSATYVVNLTADRSGLTLLETIVALAILTIGIAGVLHAFSVSITATKTAEAYSNAAILANQVASELDREDSIEAGDLSGTFEDAPSYTWTAHVEPEDSNGLMRTVITVSWAVGKVPKAFDMVVCLRPTTSTSDSSSTSESDQ